MTKKNTTQGAAEASAEAAPTITPPLLPVVTPESDPVPVGVLAVSIDPEAPPAQPAHAAQPVTVEAVPAEDIARAAVTVNVEAGFHGDPADVAEAVREALATPPTAPAAPTAPLAAVDLGLAARLDAALERSNRFGSALSAIATHVRFPPETHVHLSEPEALEMLIHHVHCTADELRALIGALEPGAAERVTVEQWSAFLVQRGWDFAGEALQGAAHCYRRGDLQVRVPTDGDPTRTATLVAALASSERLPPARVIAFASTASFGPFTAPIPE